jgi:hypothetical protein
MATNRLFENMLRQIKLPRIIWDVRWIFIIAIVGLCG